MLWQPGLQDFRWQLSSATGRPVAAMGSAITPGSNTKGSWVQLLSGAAVTEDVYGILININSNTTSTANRQALMDIGVDEAGGTSYTVKIPDLYATNASAYTIGSGGIWFYFPLKIKAGSSIAARAAGVTTSAFRTFVTLYGSPVHPELMKTGSFVVALTPDSVNSAGTVITPGTTSEGAWSSLGSHTEDLWWWQVGWGQNDASTGAAAIHLDLASGDATDKKLIVQDLLITNTTGEAQNNPPLMTGCTAYVTAGVDVYGRAQTSGIVDTATSMIAYGLGG